MIAGRADLVATVARHPLARAVRADKMALAALQSVALAYLAGDGDAIPLWRMAATPVAALRERAEALAGAVPGAKVVDTEAVAGGGSLPGLTIPSLRPGGRGPRRRRRPGRPSAPPAWSPGSTPAPDRATSAPSTPRRRTPPLPSGPPPCVPTILGTPNDA